jgi:hypothetical protein
MDKGQGVKKVSGFPNLGSDSTPVVHRPSDDGILLLEMLNRADYSDGNTCSAYSDNRSIRQRGLHFSRQLIGATLHIDEFNGIPGT